MKDNMLTRRQALARLGLSPAALYMVPSLVALSTAAHASSASTASEPSDPSVPTPPTPPSEPSNPSGPGQQDERDDHATDNCRAQSPNNSNATPSISRDDYRRAQASVDAGFSKPLNQIWNGITGTYHGQIISITFTGHRYRPRYRLRAVSPDGRLETIIVSARTGKIERVVGC